MAGPRWTADIGPVERPDPPPDAAPLAGQSSVGSLAAEGSRVRLQDGLSSAGSSPESKQMLLRSMTTVNAVRVGGGGREGESDAVASAGCSHASFGPCRPCSNVDLVCNEAFVTPPSSPSLSAVAMPLQLETKIKRAEAQLASQMTKLQQSQSRLTAKRVEAEEFRERMVRAGEAGGRYGTGVAGHLGHLVCCPCT